MDMLPYLSRPYHSPIQRSVDRNRLRLTDSAQYQQRRSPHGERGTEFQKGSDEMDEMTVAELNQYLENIAKLIEASAQDVTAAAQIVRDSKVGA